MKGVAESSRQLDSCWVKSISLTPSLFLLSECKTGMVQLSNTTCAFGSYPIYFDSLFA